MSNSSPGSLGLSVLLSVARLGDEAYGLAIRADVSARTGHDYSVGAIYTTLQRLEDNALVSSRMSEPLPVRGGRARREFTLTAAGRSAMREAHRVSLSIWADVESALRPRPV